MKKIFTLLSITLLLAVAASAQRLLTEDFNYVRGGISNRSGGVWQHLSGTGDSLRVVARSLTYPGYTTNPAANSGKLRLDTSSFNPESAFTTFQNQFTDTLYYSFLFVVNTSHNLSARPSANGRRFISFLSTSDTTVRFAAVNIKRGSVANTFTLGIATTAGTVTWTGADYPIKDTILVTVGYQFIAGDVNNVASLWVNPPTNGPQPAPNATVTDLETGVVEIDKLAIYQLGTTTPRSRIDAIKVTKGWDDAVLPLRLLSFNVINNDGHASLTWKTSNEINMNRFDIQRSLDARTFESIGSVSARNQSTEVTYSYNDPKPVSGTAYYRLNMIDNDGRSSYSGVVSINGKVPVNLSVFPNPVVNNLVLSHPKAADNAIIKIVSLNGSVVATYNVQRDAIQSSIDVSKLSKGNYIVIYNNGQQQQTIKILKQ